MSLRRTGLKRKTELRRGGELRRTPLLRRKPLQARKVSAAKRPRDTGPSRGVRWLVLDRAGGCCEICGRLLHDGTEWVEELYSIHHRQPRGMGGTSRDESNAPSNLLLLCGSGVVGCHGFVEANRRQSIAEGWLVPMGDDPAETPVTINGGTPEFAWARTVILTADGDYQDVAA